MGVILVSLSLPQPSMCLGLSKGQGTCRGTVCNGVHVAEALFALQTISSKKGLSELQSAPSGVPLSRWNSFPTPLCNGECPGKERFRGDFARTGPPFECSPRLFLDFCFPRRGLICRKVPGPVVANITPSKKERKKSSKGREPSKGGDNTLKHGG